MARRARPRATTRDDAATRAPRAPPKRRRTLNRYEPVDDAAANRAFAKPKLRTIENRLDHTARDVEVIGNLLGEERRPRLVYMLSLPNGSTVTGEDEGVVERAWTRDDGFFHAAMREALRLEPLPEHAVALKYLKLARDLMMLEKNTAAGETARTREIMEREAQDAVARALHEQ